jgi:hypothetical protein
MFKLIKTPNKISYGAKVYYHCVFSVDGHCKPPEGIQWKINCTKDNVLHHYEISNLNNNIKII